MKSRLVLRDGSSFSGWAPAGQKQAVGEVVFSTGMTGYAASLTDPSYHRQILVFSYPLIGNYGVPDRSGWESARVQVAGVVVAQACHQWHHHRAMKGLLEWLEAHDVPLIGGVDTRAVTKLLRSSGAMIGAIVEEGQELGDVADPNEELLLQSVSLKERQIYKAAGKRVIVVDCGIKKSMLRLLQAQDVEIHRVPFDYDYSNEEFDGVFLSNGPGNPALCNRTMDVLERAMQRCKPIFGICLGSQLMARAAGAHTYKLPFGHRGHNQPCLDRRSGRCFVTSQNHGYAIEESSLPTDWEVTFHNLNDGTVEGISHKEHPFSAVQFHPEAAPGPTDTQHLIEEFVAQL